MVCAEHKVLVRLGGAQLAWPAPVFSSVPRGKFWFSPLPAPSLCAAVPLGGEEMLGRKDRIAAPKPSQRDVNPLQASMGSNKQPGMMSLLGEGRGGRRQRVAAEAVPEPRSSKKKTKNKQKKTRWSSVPVPLGDAGRAGPSGLHGALFKKRKKEEKKKKKETKNTAPKKTQRKGERRRMGHP